MVFSKSVMNYVIKKLWLDNLVTRFGDSGDFGMDSIVDSSLKSRQAGPSQV